MRKLYKILTSIILVFTVVIHHSAIVIASENKDLDIEAFPDSSIFNITRMVPGDWSSRNLTILNVGEKDFTYRTEAVIKSGSEKLFNQFLLQVWDADGEIFKGKLQELKNTQPRYLKSSHQEDLKFKVEFPYELGNEYQGLGFEFEIRFIIADSATGLNPDSSSNILSSKPETPQSTSIPSETNEEAILKPERPILNEELILMPIDGQILPSTETNISNKMLLNGMILIMSGGVLFILHKNSKQNKRRP